MRNEAMCKEALADLARELGFDHYAYLNVRPVGSFAVSNYPCEWQARYFEKRYNEIDPVVAMAKSTMKTFHWSVDSTSRNATKRVRRFYEEAAEFGLCSGITIPVRAAFGHMSMLTVASHKPSVSLKTDIDEIVATSAVSQLHARLEQKEVESTAKSDVYLTAKQALCLKWSAEGKSMKAIATIENMSYHNVNFHLNNARKALDAGTVAQATALATKLKLI